MKEKPAINKAIFTVLWPNQRINACEKHAKQLVYVGKVLGLDIPIMPYSGNEKCINCLNEAGQGEQVQKLPLSKTKKE